MSVREARSRIRGAAICLLFTGALQALAGQPPDATPRREPDGAAERRGVPPLILPDPEPTRENGARVISARHLAHKPPKAAARQFQQGIEWKQKREPAKAIEHLEQAAKLDPDYWEAHAALADVYWKSGQSGAALEQLDLAISIDPNSAALYSDKAVALLAMQRPAEAESAARRAVQLEPASESSHFLLGIALLQQGHIDAETARHLAIAAKTLPQAQAALALVEQRLAKTGPAATPAGSH